MQFTGSRIRFWVTAGFILSLPFMAPLSGQVQTRPVEGLRDNTPRVFALVHARIVQKPGVIINDGTVVIRDGVIEAVGKQVNIPPDARIVDYTGRTLYPGLIELYQPMAEPKPQGGSGQNAPRQQKTEPAASAAGHWNSRVHPEWRAVDHLRPEAKTLEALRKLGFTGALMVPPKGIFRGTGALISLGDGEINTNVIREEVAQHVAFERGGFGSGEYPGSLMGAIALIRQTLLDARWYQAAQEAYRRHPQGQSPPEINLALEALQPVIRRQLPVIWEVDDDLNFFRAARIIREFGLKAIIRGSGYEYRQIQAIKATGLPVILPLEFPRELDVETPEEALNVNLIDLQHWEAAPFNPRRLHEAGIPFAITHTSRDKKADFYANLRRAIEKGLPEDAALEALTLTPARLAGVDHLLGSIEPGKRAHLIVTDKNLF
ncbi:MAG: amidohydrolase, partial [Calditrichaeota bacterium]